jgi:hypothetical protein
MSGVSREVIVCISIIWGIGLATLIRPICKTTGEECVIHSHTVIDPSWIYSNNSKCMSFKKYIVPCTNDSIPINIDSLEYPSPNFNLSINDIIILLFIIVVIWILCRNIQNSIIEPDFYITSISFISLVIINMYIGPSKRTINVEPTPFNYSQSYKNQKSDSCFAYDKIDVECTPNTEYKSFTQD